MRAQASIVVAVVAVAGCGAASKVAPTETPRSALRAFYAAILRDHNLAAACEHAAPGFYLKGTSIVAVNINGQQPGGVQVPAPLRSSDRHGTCSSLVSRVYTKRSAQYPWRLWMIQKITVRRNGTTADAVSTDGNAELQLIGRSWRVLWIFDPT